MSKWASFVTTVLRPKNILGIYILLAFIAAVQAFALGSFTFKMPAVPPGRNDPAHNINGDIVNNFDTMLLYEGCSITNYNNYVIFKQSWFHLKEGKNMYIIYPHEYWDLYKYSPSFAVLMLPLAYMPDLPALIIWCLLNTLILLVAVRRLPFSEKDKSLLLLFVAVEMLTSIQNLQSNAIMAGLMILAYTCMENRKAQWATLWLVLAAVIKIYGAAGFCIFLFYPGKLKFIGYSVFWVIIFAALPLLVTPMQTLIWQYHNWGTMLALDQSASYGLSVMGWLHSWFGLENGKSYVMLSGIILFILPLLRWRLYKDQTYRLLMLAFVLIWVIVFNHKAESPTFVIAMSGVGIWYFAGLPSAWRNVMLWTAFVFTSLSVSDIFPRYIKDHFFIPYTIKAVPCIILFVILLFQLLTMKNEENIKLIKQHE